MCVKEKYPRPFQQVPRVVVGSKKRVHNTEASSDAEGNFFRFIYITMPPYFIKYMPPRANQDEKLVSYLVTVASGDQNLSPANL